MSNFPEIKSYKKGKIDVILIGGGGGLTSNITLKYNESDDDAIIVVGYGFDADQRIPPADVDAVIITCLNEYHLNGLDKLSVTQAGVTKKDLVVEERLQAQLLANLHSMFGWTNGLDYYFNVVNFI